LPVAGAVGARFAAPRAARSRVSLGTAAAAPAADRDLALGARLDARRAPRGDAAPALRAHRALGAGDRLSRSPYPIFSVNAGTAARSAASRAAMVRRRNAIHTAP